MSGEVDEDCGEGGGVGRLSHLGDDAPRLGAATGDEPICAVGTVFLFAEQAGHVQPERSVTGRWRRPAHTTWYVPPQVMQVVGVGFLDLVAIVLLHLKHLGLEIGAVLGGVGAVAGGGGRACGGVVESLVAAGGVGGLSGGASCG